MTSEKALKEDGVELMIGLDRKIEVKKTDEIGRALIIQKKRASRKDKIKEPRITYELVGTQEENQEKMDKIFDLIFNEVLERRGKVCIDRYGH